jgi:hypothetical protein
MPGTSGATFGTAESSNSDEEVMTMYATMTSLLVLLLALPGTLSGQWRDRSDYDSGVLRAGTPIVVRLPDNLDSDRNRNGDRFEAYLDRDVVSAGRVLAPAGTRARVTLTDVNAGRYRGWERRGAVSLTLTDIEIGSRMVPIRTDTLTVSTDPRPNQRLRFRAQQDVALDAGRRGRWRDYGWRDDRYGWRSDRGRFSEHGSLRWRGRVDGSDYIELRGDQVNIRHVAAQPITEQSFDVTSPLPRQPVNVQLRRIQGRGRVELAQQPSPSNGYTAVVYIADDDGGSDIYEFQLIW